MRGKGGRVAGVGGGGGGPERKEIGGWGVGGGAQSGES